MQDNHIVTQVGSRISQWGEGPVWWNNKLIYVDIEGKAIIFHDTENDKEEVYDVGELVGTVVPCEDGTVLYGGEDGVVSFDPKTGTKVVLSEPELNYKGLNRFNEGKCDPKGRFWLGSMDRNFEEKPNVKVG